MNARLYRAGDDWLDNLIANSYYIHLADRARKLIEKHRFGLEMASSRRCGSHVSPERLFAI